MVSYDICLPADPKASGCAVIASVYSGEAVAQEIVDAHNSARTPDHRIAALEEERDNPAIERLRKRASKAEHGYLTISISDGRAILAALTKTTQDKGERA